MLVYNRNGIKGWLMAEFPQVVIKGFVKPELIHAERVAPVVENPFEVVKNLCELIGDN